MTAPDPATEAAATAIYAVYSDVRSSWIEWPNINDEAKGYFRQLATAALDAARPHADAPGPAEVCAAGPPCSYHTGYARGWAAATASERQRITEILLSDQVAGEIGAANGRWLAGLLDGGGT